ncbi:trypsin-like serine protease [Paucibacter sp. PLA-PC-4]|nr:trypsin-like serine protease [Paucibacter sp. PLA-PC-4]MCX2860777.1 trypsin-like serine protease [Paucibacter sp. PLA-PC-4]
MRSRFKLAFVAAVCCLLGAGTQAYALGDLVPNTGNTSSPSNWRFAPGQAFNGVAGALDGVASITYSNSEGIWACSGSLLAGGQYVLTAAHCADNFTSMKVEFGYYNGVASVTRNVAVGGAIVHGGWTGDLDTGADIAILKLDQKVTSIQGYKLSTTIDIGKDYLMAGYGTTSVGSSNTDTNWGDGLYGHYGYNTFDVDSQTFNQVIDANDSSWGYDADYYKHGLTYMSDFDSGINRNNTLGRLAGLTGNAWTSSNGLGVNEALIAGGDSGGGDFIWSGSEWLLSGVHSWGWEACSNFGLNCDASTSNSSSYGDLSGSTAVFSHLGWIASVTAVPEPQTYALFLAGLGLMGVATRRREAQR